MLFKQWKQKWNRLKDLCCQDKYLFFPTTLSEIDSSSFCKASPRDNTRLPERGVNLNFQTRGVIISNIKRKLRRRQYMSHKFWLQGVDVRQTLMCQRRTCLIRPYLKREFQYFFSRFYLLEYQQLENNITANFSVL